LPAIVRQTLRRAAVLAAVVAIVGCNSSAVTPPPTPSSSFPPATVARINSAITTWFGTYKAPGVIVGIWVPGKGTYESAQGKASLATGEPMQIGDHMRIGSVTKTFTVTVLLQLVQKRVLGLDDPVSKYVSYVPRGNKITLRMLANMTAGLFNYTKDRKLVRAIYTNPRQTYTPRQLLDVAFKHKPRFKPPGTGWDYSNTNTVLLGVILEKVTGKTMGQLFNEYSFRPLGLSNTVWPSSTTLPEPYAHGITENPLTNKTQDATHWNPSWAFTAGRLVSTVQDLAVWAKACATGAQISPALQKQRLKWVKFPPLTPTNTYGLGIVYKNGWLGHEGSIPGYNTMSYYLPKEDATMIVLVNSDIPTENSSPASALFRALAEIIAPNNVPGVEKSSPKTVQ
jgi:D-alanyl-D-alanine carboxypeptidase